MIETEKELHGRIAKLEGESGQYRAKIIFLRARIAYLESEIADRAPLSAGWHNMANGPDPMTAEWRRPLTVHDRVWAKATRPQPVVPMFGGDWTK